MSVHQQHASSVAIHWRVCGSHTEDTTTSWLDASMDYESFPRQQARTQRFTLGRPRSFSINPAGDRVLFIRSGGGADPVGRLWELNVESGRERELAAPAELVAGRGEQLPPEERARRERM